MQADTRSRWAAGLALAATLAVLTGCQAMAYPWLMWGTAPTKPVPAEYPYLSGKNICILVWADLDTLFTYPNVQLEVSEFVAAALKQSVRGATILPNRKVIEYQRRNPNWDRQSPAQIGAALGADRVLLIELTQYTTRDPDSPHLFRGRIAANLKVYQTDDFDAAPSYRGDVECTYPPHGAGEWGSSDDSIRQATMEAFASEAVAKFYDRKVKVQ